MYAWHSHVRTSTLSYNTRAFKHAFIIAQAHQLMGFNLVDPEQAPHNIRDSVMRGYRLVTNTGYYAPDYAHNELACTNCHLCGGDTLGGEKWGDFFGWRDIDLPSILEAFWQNHYAC